MRSPYDFPEIEGELQWESENYTGSHPNHEVAWTVLATSENLKQIHDFVSQTAGNDIDDGKKFQHILIRQGANALESLYLLTKYHQYNAARGRARYLFETYLILRRLNRNQQKAAQKWEDSREEAHTIDFDEELEPLEKQTDALHEFRKEEKKRIKKEYNQTSSYTDLYQLLSDRGSHPTSVRGSLIDGRRAMRSENSLYKIGLVFAFGIVTQYIRTFAETPTRWRIQKWADEVIVQVKFALYPKGLPTLFKDELHFWDPGSYKSPFVE